MSIPRLSRRHRLARRLGAAFIVLAAAPLAGLVAVAHADAGQTQGPVVTPLASGTRTTNRPGHSPTPTPPTTTTRTTTPTPSTTTPTSTTTTSTTSNTTTTTSTTTSPTTATTSTTISPTVSGTKATSSSTRPPTVLPTKATRSVAPTAATLPRTGGGTSVPATLGALLLLTGAALVRLSRTGHRRTH